MLPGTLEFVSKWHRHCINLTLYISVLQKGIIAHEIGHALGLIHEQSRTDRDGFVEILETNIDPSFLSNFLLVPYSLHLSPYDYNSMMHYEGFVSKTTILYYK